MPSLETKSGVWKLYLAAAFSAALLELPFPLAGPLPVWRTVFAWFGLLPLLWAILSPGCADRPAAAELATETICLFVSAARCQN